MKGEGVPFLQGLMSGALYEEWRKGKNRLVRRTKDGGRGGRPKRVVKRVTNVGGKRGGKVKKVRARGLQRKRGRGNW